MVVFLKMSSRKSTSRHIRPICSVQALNQFSVMGPPYGVRPPTRLPNDQQRYSAHTFQHPKAQRFKLFSGHPAGGGAVPTIISIGESSSSSSSTCSSDEDEQMDIDGNKTAKPGHTIATDASVAVGGLLMSSSQEEEATGSGVKRALDEPIIILSDDSDEESTKKPKVCQKKQKKGPDPMVIINMLPGTDNSELKELIQYGITLVDAESLFTKLKNLPSLKPPSKINQKELYAYVKQGDLARTVAYIKAGADPAGGVKSQEGRTPLHVAASKGHIDVFLILLYKAGLSSIDCTDNSGKTPLFLAVEKKQLDIARLLVHGGANVQVKNCEGLNLLHCSARKGCLPLVRWLLRLGVPLNGQDMYGWTALMWSVEIDANHKIIEYLIKVGAANDITDEEKNICLHWSASAGSYRCCGVLLRAPLNSHINAKNTYGDTPLHLAAKHDHHNIVELLLLNGADPSITNNEKLTPLDLCPLTSKTFHSISLRNQLSPSKNVTYHPDISHGKERVAVSCINEVDNEAYPNDFVYITSPEASSSVTVKRGLSTVRPCKCVGVCHSACKCIKLCEKQRLWYTEDGYLDLAVFEEDSPVLYECTPLCSCWSYCPNRVVQKGIQYPLQVFKTHSTGWGLRTLTAIPTGAFILPYVGELITDEEAEKRNMDTYLFNLDLKTQGDEPNCMDAVEYGNCGRFINHSCRANMKAVKLFTGHRDISYPGVAFFASRNIEPREELCFNYGNSYWEFKLKNRSGMFCRCGSDNCQYSGLA